MLVGGSTVSPHSERNIGPRSTAVAPEFVPEGEGKGGGLGISPSRTGAERCTYAHATGLQSICRMWEEGLKSGA